MTAVAVPQRSVASLRWIHGAVTDLAIASAWVPFALVALALRDNANGTALLMWATLLFSFTHQPLTLALIYGDKQQFALRRRVFTWSPVVFAVAVLVVLNVSLVTLALVGGLWNAVHTLFQRYGIIRIYGRKVGEEDGRLERAMLLAWLAAALVWTSADPGTPERIELAGLSGHNRQVVDILADLQPAAAVVLPSAMLGVVALTALWVGREVRAGSNTNPAKHLYVLSTAVLFAVILVEPIVGLIAYVGAHAVEYFVIVYTNLRTRYQARPESDAAIGRAVRSPLGRPGFLVGYFAALTALVVALNLVDNTTVTTLVVFGLGGLHVFYDGFIWKLRRREVAQSFHLPAGVHG